MMRLLPRYRPLSARSPTTSGSVLSLECYLGRSESLLTESAEHARLIQLKTPLLTEAQLRALQALQDARFRAGTLDTTFEIAWGPAGLSTALTSIEEQAVKAVSEGVSLLILSDQDATLERAPIPMLIVVGAVHRALIRSGLRMQTSLI